VLSIAASLKYALELARYGYSVGGVQGASTDISFNRAVEVVSKLLKQRKEYPLAAVKGPPGTGKTTIYLKVFAESVNSFGGGDVGLYVAPTNQLVVESLSRHLLTLAGRMLRGRGSLTLDEIEDILTAVRAFGSRVSPGTRQEIEQILASGLIDCAEQNEVCVDKLYRAVEGVVRDHINLNVKWIFSTEWQDVLRRISISRKVSLPSRIALWIFVDEASRSPLYKAFMPIVKLLEARLMSEGRGEEAFKEHFGVDSDILGLSVIGDDQQAIALHSYFHLRKDLLLLLRIHEVLKKGGLCREEGWRGELCSMLDVTKRLPNPSHVPISEAYYEGRLKAMEDAINRLSKLRDIADALRRKANRNVNGPMLRRIFETIADAIYRGSPIVVVNVVGFEPRTTREPLRAYIAAQIAAALSKEICGRHDMRDITVAVTGIYGDVVSEAKITYQMLGGRMCSNVRFATVHSMLGDEADIHITMLGKEWFGPGIDPWTLELDLDYATMYFREPELLNVQLSRHKRLLIVIGNLKGLQIYSQRLSKDLRDTSVETHLRGFLRRASRSLSEASGIIIELASNYGTFVGYGR
jgi:hypothetical protein